MKLFGKSWSCLLLVLHQRFRRLSIYSGHSLSLRGRQNRVHYGSCPFVCPHKGSSHKNKKHTKAKNDTNVSYDESKIKD